MKAMVAALLAEVQELRARLVQSSPNSWPDDAGRERRLAWVVLIDWSNREGAIRAGGPRGYI